MTRKMVTNVPETELWVLRDGVRRVVINSRTGRPYTLADYRRVFGREFGASARKEAQAKVLQPTPDPAHPRLVDDADQPAAPGRYVDDEAGELVVVGARGQVLGRYALPTAPTAQKR